MAKFDSQWYPYNKIQEGYYDLSESEGLLSKIIDYILDLPDAKGYRPKDDNSYPRCRLWKFLYYDGERPTDNPLPSSQEKISVLYDAGMAEDAPAEKGYRLIPRPYIKPTQENANTQIYCFLGRVIAENDFTAQMSVVFDIMTHHTLETNTKLNFAYSRTWSLTQCLIQAFHGVNIAGVGTFYFDRARHPDCGVEPLYDKDADVGYRLTIGVEIKSVASNANEENNYIPIGKEIYAG